ncbi:S8 family serine peptidase [Streptomyces sp. NPDC007084]|uniref:S8 family peptidase n=1 Tax=Streptomyces sp. NPDC007084 TaxID=3154313 RepID=UPI003456AE30
MARTRKWRLRWGAGITAVTTAAVLSAVAPPAQAFPEGRILGAGEPGSVGGSYIVTLGAGTRASSPAGADLAEAYGARISHTYGTVLNGFAVRLDERRARRLAADPRVASVVQDTRVALDTVRTDTGRTATVRTDTGGTGGARKAGARKDAVRTDDRRTAEARTAEARTAEARTAGARTVAVRKDAVQAVRKDAVQKDPPSWGLDRIDQRDRPLDRRYAAPASAGAGVTAYVIDTGVRVTHQDFGGRASYGWDFVDGDRAARDGNGHGTHVAATLAGRRYGVAKKARVVAVRVLDDRGAGTTAQVIAGIDWVTRHARKPAVANLSLGGYGNAQLDAAVRDSIASGVTYTVAAGNDGRPAAGYSPARVREALTVGASDRTDTRAAFSNTGPAVDLFAPGVAITSASYTGDRGKVARSGTSMASPHVAGVAALYLSGHPRAAPEQVAKALVKLAVPGKLSGVGLGSPNRLLNVG